MFEQRILVLASALHFHYQPKKRITMQFQDFQNFALTTEQTTTIVGGSWRAIRNSLMGYYGNQVSGITTETPSSFNPLTGQMSESDMINMTIEFADGTGTTVSIHKSEYDRCYSRICRIFNF